MHSPPLLAGLDTILRFIRVAVAWAAPGPDLLATLLLLKVIERLTCHRQGLGIPEAQITDFASIQLKEIEHLQRQNQTSPRVSRNLSTLPVCASLTGSGGIPGPPSNFLPTAALAPFGVRPCPQEPRSSPQTSRASGQRTYVQPRGSQRGRVREIEGHITVK